MSLAQGEPFVLTYRLGIIGLAQWVDMHEASFTILFHSLKLDKVCPDSPLPRSLPGRQLHLETSLSPSWLSQAGLHVQYHTSLSLFATVSLIIMKPKMPPHTFFSLSRIDAFFQRLGHPPPPRGAAWLGSWLGSMCAAKHNAPCGLHCSTVRGSVRNAALLDLFPPSSTWPPVLAILDAAWLATCQIW